MSISKKKKITMKIERVTCIYWKFVYAMIFELQDVAKNEILDFSGKPVWVRVTSSSILYVNELEKFQW